ncbi:MAG: succinate dehydrogenase/fumarate reductase iron-sulfur subunit [Methanocalculaceae archaeon]|jgi:fumarate reductase (CoM/CoB) subunit B|nr:succinate dehydrogenase/fumarate reductase iron-sulfur subunit [Methanocalculaceae archaeon]
MKVRVSRLDPAADTFPHTEEYEVWVDEEAIVLNVLDAVHDTIDPTLGYRYCCRAGQCGSCAVRVNGEPVLACMEEIHDGDLIEPLELPRIRDLIADIAPMMAQVAWLNPGTAAAECGCNAGVTYETLGEIKPLRDCIECYSCISSCPAFAASEYAGPTNMRQEQRLNLDPRDMGDRIDEAICKGLFACTTCHKCVEVCPKGIEIPKKAVEKLRAAAAKRGLSLPVHRALAKLIEETGRSIEQTETPFLERVPEVVEPEGDIRATVSFFAGCMFNGRVIQPALDAIEVLRKNGIRVIIPKDQVCCGSPLIRTGLLEFVPELQKRNIDAFLRAGADTVLTMCAGCGATLKNDYSTPFHVADITEFLAAIGFIPPKKVTGVYTYHDPCHLLRGQGICKQPRELLQSVAETFVDMPARCCGAGGGVKSGRPEEAATIGAVRAEMVKKTGADCIVTICPFCEFHLHQVTGLPVKNIATLMLEGYQK